MPTLDHNPFHGEEQFIDEAPPIGLAKSLRTLVAALWRNRSAISANGAVAAVKEIVPDLPLNDPMSRFISNEVMHMLWGSMLHPPSSYKGAKYQYRSADGSNNSMLNPDLGRAGLPYAKSIQAQQAVHGAKPDPGDLFDLLMARDDDKARESDTGISSFLLYQATIVIHDVFRSNDYDKNISDTSSYLDLSPLYGKDKKDQQAVRTMHDGLLKPDTFAEHRLLNQPPGVSIFLIMYNRFHNYAAKQLKEINENGKFELPLGYENMSDKLRKEARAKLDEDLFQTARLITCGLYAQIAVHDYLRCLMMIHAKDTAWTMDPRRPYDGLLDKGTVARGQGNMVSVEFNLLYRFHSALSKKDSDWSTALLELWMRKNPSAVDDDPNSEAVAKGEKITTAQLRNGDIPAHIMGQKIKAENIEATKRLAEKRKAPFFPLGFDSVGPDPTKFAFQRKEDGYFDDAQLVAELVRSMEDPMCSFGAQQTPKMFKSIEMLGILQSRKWEVASLNEFRQFFKMSKHKTFEDINTDKEICNKLRDLYGHPDNVELYPGFVCEGQGRSVDPNTSCPNGQGTALWRGIFSDAVTLVRSDRFYTEEWNVNSNTAWGMHEVTSDPTINKGGLLYKLCHRAFPGYFTYNSLHLWQPYYTPAKNLLLAEQQGHLKNLDVSGLEYQFDGDDKKNWTPVNVTRNANGEIRSDFFKNLAALKGKPLRVRRKLVANPKLQTVWRGGELAMKIDSSYMAIGADFGNPRNPQDLGDYTTIKSSILGGQQSASWANPALLVEFDIPKGPLRDILTNRYTRWDQAMNIVGGCMGANQGNMQSHFRAYFSALAANIREREQRPFQKLKGEQIYQIDVVKDYAIPVLVHLVADMLGFWSRVKTSSQPKAEFSENAIYNLIDNCQDFQSYDADQTKGMKRRQGFQRSILTLKKLTDDGITQSSAGWFWLRNAFRTYGNGSEAAEVIAMRKASVNAIQTLLSKGFKHDEVSAIMLAFALDSAHKLVLNFTEILAYFIDPKTHHNCTIGKPAEDERTQHWANLQKLAFDAKSEAQITKYVLEAQRLSPSIKLARQYIGTNTTSIKGQAIKKGTTILVDVHEASQNPKVFHNPQEFRLDRQPSDYLIFGSVIDDKGKEQPTTFAKQLSLAYLTSLVKHTAQLKECRVAHDKLGRLKRVKTPSDLPGYPAGSELERYASSRWDQLLPFPSTWEVRYNGGVGRGIFQDGDNANQGHGQNQVYQMGDLSDVSSLETDMEAQQVKQVVSEVLKTSNISSKLSSLTKASDMLDVSVREVDPGFDQSY